VNFYCARAKLKDSRYFFVGAAEHDEVQHLQLPDTQRGRCWGARSGGCFGGRKLLPVHAMTPLAGLRRALMLSERWAFAMQLIIMELRDQG
jgi:hypothetical protein